MTPAHNRSNRIGIRNALKHFKGSEGAIKYYKTILYSNDFTFNTGSKKSLEHSITVLTRYRNMQLLNNTNKL